MPLNVKTSVFSPTYKIIGNHYSYSYNEKAKLDKLKIGVSQTHQRNEFVGQTAFPKTQGSGSSREITLLRLAYLEQELPVKDHLCSMH